MAKKKNGNTGRKWLTQNLFPIAAVIVAVANLWFFVKLAPIALSVSELNGRVLANENGIETFGEDLKYIRGRVDELYNLFIKP